VHCTLRYSAVALLAATSPLFAQQNLPVKRAPTPTTPAITVPDLMSRMYLFADDSLAGRMAGSPEALKGTQYIADELKRLGLQPAGENGTFFQDVPFGVQTLDSTGTITAGGKTLKAGQDFLAFGPLGAPGRSGRTDVVYAGVALDTANVLPLDQVRGKLLIIRQATIPPTNPQAFVASAGYKAYVAALQAASAVAVITGPALSPGQVRNAFTPSAYVSVIPQQTEPTPVTLNLTESAAEAIFGSSLASATKGAAGTPVDLNVKFALSRRPGRNVIAMLPGSDPKLKNQYVAIGAHSDHVGVRSTAVEHDSLRAYNTIARPQGADSRPHQPTPDEWTRIRATMDSLRKAHGGPRLDSIHNGADDDASGSMGILEIAEAFARANPRPRRSLLFVWHIGEEEGMLGSGWFTDHPTVSLDSIVAQLNVDMIGRGMASDVTGEAKDGSLLHGRDEGYVQLIGSRRLSTQLGDLVEDVNTKQKLGFQIDYGLDADGHPQNIYCRSDHYMYARYGIPIVFFTTGGHRDYHQVTDEPQYIAFDHYRRVTQLIHDVAARVANLDERPVIDKAKPDPKAGCRQ
jgi:hypothetical protein